MPPVGFEPTISAGERPQTYALDRAATGTGIVVIRYHILFWKLQTEELNILLLWRHNCYVTMVTIASFRPMSAVWNQQEKGSFLCVL